MPKGPSQLMELFLALAEGLGHSDSESIANLADAGPESVANWRTGAVREFKNQKFRAAVDNITAQLKTLRDQAGYGAEHSGLTSVEVEDGASPSDIQREFRERVHYDYLGHRFLYFDSPGALAWKNLIRDGYEQSCWLAGVEDCARAWLDATTDGTGSPKGAISKVLGLGRRSRSKGLDLVSLGPGEGGKETAILKLLLALADDKRRHPSWVTLSLVDISIPLLLTAARRAHQALADSGLQTRSTYAVRPFCADFEHGSMAFVRSLRTKPNSDEDARLVLLLGNVLGNVRDEDLFVREKLGSMVRPGDLLWVEVGLRQPNPANEPLFAATLESTQPENASQANRRLLLEGPYRRWAAARGRGSVKLKTRIWARENDESTRVPGSLNFCHDLFIEDEGRACTVLYSRRYSQPEIIEWFEARDYQVLGIRRTADSQGTDRVVHLLLQRRLS